MYKTSAWLVKSYFSLSGGNISDQICQAMIIDPRIKLTVYFFFIISFKSLYNSSVGFQTTFT